mgnify:CR=1 FL=1
MWIREGTVAILVDHSGSLREAWKRAWEVTIDILKNFEYEPVSIYLLAFKEKSAIPFSLMAKLDNTNSIFVEHGVVISIPDILREKGKHFVKLMKEIPNPLIPFGGYTPLNSSVKGTINYLERRYEEVGLPYEVVVVTDNRSSVRVGRDISHKDVKDYIDRVKPKGLQKITLIPVGDALLRYLDYYNFMLLHGKWIKLPLTQAEEERIRVVI